MSFLVVLCSRHHNALIISTRGGAQVYRLLLYIINIIIISTVFKILLFFLCLSKIILLTLSVCHCHYCIFATSYNANVKPRESNIFDAVDDFSLEALLI